MILWVLSTLAGAPSPVVEGPPVLLDPRAAAEHSEVLSAQGGAEALLRAAEIAVLAGRAGRALQMLEQLELEIEDQDTRSRRRRLELDACVALDRKDAVLKTAAALGAEEGWARHAAAQLSAMDRRSFRRLVTRFGGTCYALALASLAVLAGREILKIRRSIVLLAALVAAGIGLAAIASPLVARIAALLELAWLVLAHAASAAAARTPPVVRLQLLLVSAFLLGVIGAGVAILTPLVPTFLLEALG